MNRLKSTIISILIITITFVSCKYIMSKENPNINEINYDKQEAKYLTKLAQKNLNIINMCEAFEDLNVNPEFKVLISEIKDEQSLMFSGIETLAKQNLISVASLPEANFRVDKKNNDSILLKNVLKSISKTQKKQILILDTLIQKTNDNDIKAIAQNYIETIENNQKIILKGSE